LISRPVAGFLATGFHLIYSRSVKKVNLEITKTTSISTTPNASFRRCICPVKTVNYDLKGERMENIGKEKMHEEKDRSIVSLNPHNPDCGVYKIHVQGQLDSHWSDWLEGLKVLHMENGESILYGCIADQAALMGILNKLNRLNINLVSVNEIIKGKNRR
jgi:hypothetical protein